MRRIGLLGIILAGFGLRLYQLGGESLWYDETVSVVLARKSLTDLIAHTAGDIHPPGYYILLHFWQALTQPSLTHGLEFLFAWPSVCFGMLTLALLYALGQRLLTPPAALLATLLGAVNPFQIWYSQEVRMYTLGATLGLICLWALIAHWQVGLRNALASDRQMQPPDAQGFLQSESGPASRRGAPKMWAALILYICAAVAGLYTLYYFLFTIAALNVTALLLWRRLPAATGWPRLRHWLLAQVGVLLLWSPWLPTFYQQTVNPPVPPWRTPWHSLSGFVDAVAEGSLALFLGQSFPLAYGWVWIVACALALILFYRYAQAGRLIPGAGTILTLYLLVPVVAIYGLTATVTPLYHVRYLSMYAPPFLLVLAVVMLTLRRIHRSAPWLMVALLTVASLISLQRFWFDPAYRADDHRAAVAQLAADWRPGDAILVNAGWAYTVLETYWPAQSPLAVQWPAPSASLPPPLAASQRLSASVATTASNVVAKAAAKSADEPNHTASMQPFLIRTGSVDGDATLGWNSPHSDFFAMPHVDVETAIERLAAGVPRIWHYRLYDTVSDPHGATRLLLAQNAHLVNDLPYPGRDFLRVQLYETALSTTLSTTIAPTQAIDFEDALRLIQAQVPARLEAGQTAYVTLGWMPLAAASTLDANLSMSLRLYDAAGQLLAQSDSAPATPTSAWRPGEAVRQPLRMPVPVAAQPGRYALTLIVYRQDDGSPLLVPSNESSVLGQQRLLAELELDVAAVAPRFGPAQATFDYIDLLQSLVDRAQARAGDTFGLTLYWQPRPNAYTDSYNVVIKLVDAAGNAAQEWVAPAGGAAYPSGTWPAERPVQDHKQLSLDPHLAPGDYALMLQLQRASDDLPIRATKPWSPFTTDTIRIGSIKL